MLKILGSGRVDDFNKVVIEDSVMKALDVKPGDSVLVYKRLNENGLGIYKAENANVTNECDSPRKNHLMGMPAKLRFTLMLCFTAITFGLVVAAIGIGDFSSPSFIAVAVMWIVASAFIIAATLFSERIDQGYESQRLVTSGNPYVKDRQVGFSKLTGDGYIYTGQIYVNSLFGSNPSSVEIDMNLDDGRGQSILSSCTKSVSGYSIHKLRFKEENISDGMFDIRLTFPYIGKTIIIDAKFRMLVEDDGKITIEEGPLAAKIEFDEVPCERQDVTAAPPQTEDEAE